MAKLSGYQEVNLKKVNKLTCIHMNVLFMPRSGIEPCAPGNSDFAKATASSAHGATIALFSSFHGTGKVLPYF